MDLKYEYTSIEDGGTQYDDYDLKSQNIVPASYVKAKLEIDEGNPFIEALPFPREEKEVLIAYSKSIPSYNFEKTTHVLSYNSKWNYTILNGICEKLTNGELQFKMELT